MQKTVQMRMQNFVQNHLQNTVQSFVQFFVQIAVQKEGLFNAEIRCRRIKLYYFDTLIAL